MIDFSTSRSFNFDVPIDHEEFIKRKHRYKIYRSAPRNQLVFVSFKLNEVYNHLRYIDYNCSVCVVKQYLGADGFFHTYSKEYFNCFSNQLKLSL